MTARIAVAAFASQVWPDGGGRSDAELLGPVVDRALEASGVPREDIGVVCSAGSEFASGMVGSIMDVFDVLPCWPPRTHTHLEGDGAFAAYEAWVRLLAGEAAAALVCAYGRPLAEDPASLLTLQLDPYLVAPLGPRSHHVAALQARALLNSGRYEEQDLAAVTGARRGMPVDQVLAQPAVASPLRSGDCSTSCAGAAAMVLVTAQRAVPGRPAAWITGIDQRIDSGALGGRDLARSPSIEIAADRLGLPGTGIDVLECHAPYSHQELIIRDALRAARIGSVNPSGGALPADPLPVTGLIRVGTAAACVLDGRARRAVGHATSGPCLQHNLLCLLEAGR